MLYFPNNEGLLFNHTLTKSLRAGASNVFGLKRHVDPTVCPVTAVEVYVNLCDLLKVPVRRGFLFCPLNPSGEVLPAPFGSVAAQSRLSLYASQLPDLADRNVTLHGKKWLCDFSCAGWNET